jgi:hypothetical protein
MMLRDTSYYVFGYSVRFGVLSLGTRSVQVSCAPDLFDQLKYKKMFWCKYYELVH